MSSAVLNPSFTLNVAVERPAKPVVRKPRIWTPFLTLFVAFIGAQALGFALVIALAVGIGLVHGANGDDPAGIDIQGEVIAMLDGTFLGFLLALLPFQMVLAGVTLLAAKLSPVPTGRRLGFVRPAMPRFGWTAMAFAPLATLAVALLSAFVTNLLTPYDPSSSPLNVTQPTLAVTLMMTLLTALIPAVVEEMLFRGYVQQRLLQRWPAFLAIGISSVLFALMHLDSIHHIIAVLPLGILLGVLAYRTKSIVPGIVFHGLHNLYCGGFDLLGQTVTSHLSDSAAGIALLVTLGSALLMGLPAAVFLMVRRIEPLATPEELVLVDEILEPADGELSQVLAPAALPQYADDPLTTLSA